MNAREPVPSLDLDVVQVGEARRFAVVEAEPDTLHLRVLRTYNRTPAVEIPLADFEHFVLYNDGRDTVRLESVRDTRQPSALALPCADAWRGQQRLVAACDELKKPRCRTAWLQNSRLIVTRWRHHAHALVTPGYVFPTP